MEKEKLKYKIPEIEIIQLDTEISLALESDPMEGPNEVFLLKSREYQKNNPFDVFA